MARREERNERRLLTRLYHPKWYRTTVSTYWWSRQWSHFKFILRELSSIFVAYFVVLTLLLLGALSTGRRVTPAFRSG